MPDSAAFEGLGGRVAEMIAEEAAMERRSKELKEHEKFNPYVDPVWKENSRKNLRQLCCDIKAYPRWQQQIINRVALGYPALVPPNQRRAAYAAAAQQKANQAAQNFNRSGGPQGQAKGQGAGQFKQGRPLSRPGGKGGLGRGGGGQGRGRRGGG